MTDEQRYMFDLQGYIVLKNVVPEPVIQACNKTLDQLENMPVSDYSEGVSLGKERTDNELYISNVVEAGSALYPFIDVPEVIDVVDEISLGLYRLNHTYAIYRWGTGYTYLHMAATPPHPKATFMFQGGQMFSLLTKAVFPIQNNEVEDGCFAVVPGSHKSNYKRPYGDHPEENPALVAVPAQAGDAIVFTEALTHGSSVNVSGKARRTIYYCYSVGYMPDWGKFGLKFTPNFEKQLSERQREIVCLKI
jgi:hypothetical protein